MKLWPWFMIIYCAVGLLLGAIALASGSPGVGGIALLMYFCSIPVGILALGMYLSAWGQSRK